MSTGEDEPPSPEDKPMEEPDEVHQLEEPEETEHGAETPPEEPMGEQEQQEELEEPEEETIQVSENKNVLQVSLRRARSEERASIEAKRCEQESLDRRSRSPSTPAQRLGNRSRRSSQLAECGCWDCERRGDRDTVMGEYRDATGLRRMRVKATWTPEARSRAGSRSGSSKRHRDSRSPRQRSAMSARDNLLDETRRQAKKERRVMERTKAALIRKIREGEKELTIFDKMKRLRNVKDKRMEEIAKDDIVVGRIEVDGPWVAEGTVEEVCRGSNRQKPMVSSLPPR